MLLKAGLKSRAALPFISLLPLAFIICVFLLGGGSRADTQSLVVLRPLAVLGAGLAFLLATRGDLGTVRRPLIFMGIMTLLVAVQLIPLPPAVWTLLPGRDVAVASLTAAGLPVGWMPWTLTPFEGWNSLFALSIPFAMLLMLARDDDPARARMLAVLIAIIGISAALALLQIIGPPRSALYLYRVTNNGSAVGLFANRNHQALLLAASFPLLSAWYAIAATARIARIRAVIAGIAVLAIVPLIIATGSRVGLLLALVGLAAAAGIYGRTMRDAGSARRSVSRIGLIAAGAIAITGVALIAWLSGQGQTIDRVLGEDPVDDLRFRVLPVLIEMVGTYFPFGSGAGSFVSAFKVAEPRSLLRPDYLNHAHNDVLETAIEHGVFGMALMLAAVTGWAQASWLLVRRAMAGDASHSLVAGLAASAVLVMVAIGSLFDYPLRVPSISALTAIMAVWLYCSARTARPIAAETPPNQAKFGSTGVY